MENTQGKKPAEWFKQLKEPYRSEAIENINSELINSYCESISNALYSAFMWAETPQGHKQWIDIHESITAGETTYLETELINNTYKLKPEQMESGKWYVIEAVYLWLIKLKNINNQDVNVYKSICTDSVVKYKYEDFNQFKIQHIKSIRHATKEEVLKYFDETFENVSLINEVNNTQVTEQQNESQPEKTEPDYKAKFEELQKDYDNLNFCYKRLMSIKEENDLAYEALDAKYSKLELQQNNQKVYFFYDTEGNVRIISDLEYALELSEEKERIYEAICIGKKKSVLVSE